MMQRAFRFGVVCGAFTGAAKWREQARRIESLGYSTILVPDGFAVGFDPLLVLAKAIVTLDQLSSGRVEFGIGAGYRAADYEMGGIPYDSAGVRIQRMEESIQLAKRLFTQDVVDFHGKYVSVSGMPRQMPAQQPYPPIFIGGGGKRMLTVAAQEADIVGIHGVNTAQGMDMSDTTPQAIEQKLGWVRGAAGERFEHIELACAIFRVVPDEGRSAGNPWGATDDSLHTLRGRVDAIADELQRRRERFGFSYLQVPASLMELFAPVVERLAGK